MSSHPSIPFLLELLRLAMRKEAAALYIVPWMPPTLRIDERSVPLSSVSFTPEQATLLVRDLLDDGQRAALDHSREIEFSFVLDDIGRFRVHAFRRHGQPALTIRPFALGMPTPGALALPTLACQVAMAERGLLVLASRSGTLRRDAAAALLEQRNHRGDGELAVLDGATRFWHESARCRVHQGLDLAAVDALLQRRMGSALAAAPPLAIAWGELRDGPQLEHVVRAAGRALCLVTLAADTPLQVLQRLLGLAAEHTGNTLLHRCAIQLHAVIALRPVPAAAGTRELAMTEVLLNTPQVAAELAAGNFDTLAGLLQPGTQTPGAALAVDADAHLHQLLLQGRITSETALRHAHERGRMAQLLHAGERPAQTAAPPAPAWAAPLLAACGQVPAASAPLRVDSDFADLFDTASPPLDAFAFAEPAAFGGAPDTQFDEVQWPHAAPSSPAAHPSTTARSLALQPQPLAARAPSPHSLQFDAWTTPAVAPGRTATIDLWVARVEQADVVAQLAHADRLPAAESAVIEGRAPPLLVQLRIDGVLSAPGAQGAQWSGQPLRVRFQVPVPAHALPGLHAARVRLGVGGLPIGELSFMLALQSGAPATGTLEDAHAARRMLHSAYASFDPSDRDAVLQALEPLRQLAPDLDVYLGAPQLRSTTSWRQRIEAEVGQRERLFLFWSRAAADSPWVDYEWRQLLRQRGPGFIDLVLLQPPRLAPLPPELADLPLTLRRADA